ncbi:MAG: hypothetical protein Fur0025_07820 [Oscillatoriaceae cyanobacterium]
MSQQILIEDLEEAIIEKLKNRAQRQGRTLAEEVKAILQAAAAVEVVEKAKSREEAWKIIEEGRKKYAGKIFSDSVELLREDRNR